MFTIILQDYLNMLLQPRALISLLAVLVLAIVFAAISKKTLYNTRVLAYGALSISIAFILSYVKLIQFPNGGTITVASMLPLFIFAYVFGPRAGIAAGLCYGVLQAIQDPYILGFTQFLLDYPIAFSLLGLAGFFRKNIFLGVITGSLTRFICHFLSGVVFFATYAEGQNVFVYSLVYNISYILPDMLICMGLLAVPNFKSAIERLRASSVNGNSLGG